MQGFLGQKAIFSVLSENNAHEVAYRMITQTTAPGYGDWMKRGATTLWESWSGEGSQNHIMFGDVSAWFYKYLAGIRMEKMDTGPGAFKHFSLHPLLVEGLTSMAASVTSIRGKIESRWTVEGNRFEWKVTILPILSQQSIFLPLDSTVITESGRFIENVAEINS